MDENKICKDREPKYNYCIIKYKELYLKEFSLYPRVDCENNEVTFEADYIFTSGCYVGIDRNNKQKLVGGILSEK